MNSIKRKNGFTMIDILIALILISILSYLAVGSYFSNVLQTNRADGTNALHALSMAQERYRANHTSYGTLTNLSASSTSPQGNYTLSISGLSATAYTLTATAQGKQAGDTGCTTLTLSLSAGALTKSPANCW